MEHECGKYFYEKEKGMEKGIIKIWYIQTGFLLTFEISCLMYKKANQNESIMSIDTLVCGYRGKVSFIASINPNEKRT